MVQRRDLRLMTVRECADEVRRLLETGYDRAGQWSLAEVCDHVNKGFQMTFDDPTRPAPKPLPSPLRWVFRRLFLGKVMRGEPMRFRAKAPADSLPGKQLDEAGVVRAFCDSVAALEQPQRPFRAMHPVFGNFTRDQWLAFQAWHASHHLSFLIPRNSG